MISVDVKYIGTLPIIVVEFDLGSVDDGENGRKILISKEDDLIVPIPDGVADQVVIGDRLICLGETNDQKDLVDPVFFLGRLKDGSMESIPGLITEMDNFWRDLCRFETGET